MTFFSKQITVSSNKRYLCPELCIHCQPYTNSLTYCSFQTTFPEFVFAHQNFEDFKICLL